MIQPCDKCKIVFLTEADPYGFWNHPDGHRIVCHRCFVEMLQETGLIPINKEKEDEN